jgi:hypothetical protein
VCAYLPLLPDRRDAQSYERAVGALRSTRGSCEEIFAAQERLYQDEYARIPTLGELCARHGDQGNRRVYMMSRDVERRWLAMHARATGIKPPID